MPSGASSSSQPASARSWPRRLRSTSLPSTIRTFADILPSSVTIHRQEGGWPVAGVTAGGVETPGASPVGGRAHVHEVEVLELAGVLGARGLIGHVQDRRAVPARLEVEVVHPENHAVGEVV